MVVGLDYRDARSRPHDLLQELKTHPKIRKILEGGERIEWGAKTIPSGGFHALPRRAARARPAPVRRRRRHGQRADAQGRALRDRVGTARRRGRVRARCSAATTPATRARVVRRRGARRASSGATCTRCATCARCSGAASSSAARSRSAMTDLEGARRAREDDGRARRRAAAARHRPRRELPGARRQAHLRQALVGVRLGQQDPRRPAEPHPDRSGACRATSRELWAHMCPAQVYEVGRPRATTDSSTVEIAPSNCVQCGAITAKGGRLTPPEGGSGPEYTRT